MPIQWVNPTGNQPGMVQLNGVASIAGIAVGDIAFVYYCGRVGVNPNANMVADGWSGAGIVPRSFALYWKPVDAAMVTAGGPTVYAAACPCIVFAIRGLDTSAPVDLATVTSSPDDLAGSYIINGITTTVDGDGVLYLGACSDNNIISSITPTDAATWGYTAYSSDANLAVGLKVMATAGPSGTVTVSQSGTGDNSARSVVIKAAPSEVEASATGGRVNVAGTATLDLVARGRKPRRAHIWAHDLTGTRRGCIR